MVTSSRMQRVRLMLWLACGGFACSDSTPVGLIECIGEHIRCGLTERQSNPDALQLQPPRDEVSTAGLDVLMPVWSGRPFENVADARVTLVADAEGGLWSITVPDDQMKLTKIDRAGATIEEHTIDPPKGSRKWDRTSASLEYVMPAQAHSKATAGVIWLRGCDGRASDPPDCQINELLVFDAFEKPPRRFEMEVSFPAAAYANASGLWLTFSNGFRIDKLDSSANLVWSQSGRLDNGGWSWQVRGALHPDNKLRVLVWAGDYDGTVGGLDLWELTATGSIDKRQPIAWSGQSPLFAGDAQGRDVIVDSDGHGDLTLMRVFPNGTSEGNLILREDYQSLRPDGFEIDTEGAVYVATKAGGREPDQQRALLCQLPATGAARCFTLGEISISESVTPLIDELVVPVPGVVYIRSGANLRRYELPDQ